MKKLFILFLVTVAVLLQGCDDPLQDIKIQVSTDDVLKYTYIAQIENAADGPLPEGLTVAFGGPDADKIIDASGNKLVEPVAGIVPMALMPGVVPSEANPVTFTMSLKAEGFVPMVRTITITDTVSDIFGMAMLQLDNLPGGTGYVKSVFTDYVDPVTGAAKAPRALEIPATADKPLAAKVEIASGTVFYDRNGNAITAGSDLDVQVVQYTDLDEGSLMAFPGGLTATEVIDEAGNPLPPVNFTTAGLAQIDMFIEGTEVKSFSKPLNVTIELNENTLNPDNDYAQVAAGDSIPVWSMDDETGVWKYEGMSVVQQNFATGKLEASMAVPHLSPWNWDWGWRPWWSWNPTCNAVVNVNSNNNTRSSSESYYCELINVRNGQVLSATRRRLFNGERIWFNWIRRNTQVKMRVWSGNSWWNRGQLLAESNTFNSCSSGDINIQLEQSQPVSITAIGRCSNNGSRELRPGLRLWVKEPRGNFFSYRYIGRMRNGNITINTRAIKLNQQYEFATVYRGRVYSHRTTLTSPVIEIDMDLPASVCSGL